jgi:hypothetical protein
MLTVSYPDRPGFREHASGLLVPEEQSRAREVWGRDEWKLLERVTKLLATRGLELFIGCTEPGCGKAPLERVRRPDGGITLRCEHKDRDFVRYV